MPPFWPGARRLAHAIIAIAAMMLVVAGPRTPLRVAGSDLVLANVGAACAAQATREHGGAPRSACDDFCRHCLRADAPLDAALAIAVSIMGEAQGRFVEPAPGEQRSPRCSRTASWSSRAPPAIG